MSELPQATPMTDVLQSTHTNGITDTDTDDLPLHLLERELPVVYDDQILLKELLQRVVQTIYAELSEMAETYGHCARSDLGSCLIECAPGFQECRTWRENGR